jgi:DNA-binding LacI/PurR family transcriptional regulator
MGGRMRRETGDGRQRIRNISELAKLAGVSAGTVSRALAGKELVNTHTRERIQALAREHGFRPNQMASRLRTGQTGVIGVVIPPGRDHHKRVADPFFQTMVCNLADALGERGYDLMLSRVIATDPDEWLDRIVDSGMVDGVLLIGQSDQDATIERVAETYRPLVAWGFHRAGQRHCAVGTDSLAGGQIATRHLIERGCRRIAFFGDVRGIETAQRLAGARAAATGTVASIEAVALPFSGEGMAGQVAAGLDRMDPQTDGLFAASDAIAIAALRLLRQRGRRVPDDIAVVGFGDLPMASQTFPQLTTVHQDIAAGARTMVEVLLRRIAGEDVAATIIEPALVIRESA